MTTAYDTEESLLRAVEDSPDDSTVKLILADYYEEVGDDGYSWQHFTYYTSLRRAYLALARAWALSSLQEKKSYLDWAPPFCKET